MAAQDSNQNDWAFLQCFGERTPGEDIQEGGGGVKATEEMGQARKYSLDVQCY